MNHQTPRARKLLIVTYHIPPSGAVAAFRMLGFARHLPRYGWHVGFVAPPRVPYEPVDEALLKRLPPETKVFPAPYPQGLVARAAAQFIYHGVWLPRGLPAAIAAVRRYRPDAILTSGPPHCVHFIGLALQQIFHLPWVASFRDPWSTNAMPVPPRFPWGAWEWYCEKRVVSAADCIVANTPLACAGFEQAHPRFRHKMTYVTNGFDPEFFPPPTPPVPLNERFTILHAGELYGGRDPRPLFDALQALEKTRSPGEPPMRLRMLGQSTDHRLDLQSAIAERGLQHIVEFGGQVPYAEALSAMTKADVLLLIDTPGRKISIPAKLFEYLGAARPILCLAESEGDPAWALRTSGTPHRVAPPLDAVRIRQALVELRDGLRQHTLSLPSADQLTAFTRAKVAENLAGHLDRLAFKKHAAGAAALAKPQSSTPHESPQRLHAAPPTARPHYAGA